MSSRDIAGSGGLIGLALVVATIDQERPEILELILNHKQRKD